MLKKWKESNCKIHSYLIKECACLYNPPYKLFKFPSILRNGEKREKWIGELDEKTKKKKLPPCDNDKLCSDHFVDGEQLLHTHSQN